MLESLLFMRWLSSAGEWRARGFLPVLLIVAGLLLSFPGSGSCQEVEGGTSTGAKKDSAVVKAQADLSKTVQKMANNIDRFFGTDRYQTWENNQTSIRLRLNFDFIQGQDMNLGAEVKFNIFLPGISDRLSIVANPEDDEGTDDGGGDSIEESELALRWVGGKIGKADSSYDLGLRIRDGDLAGFLRWNLQRNFALGTSRWNSRITNRLYWYTDTHFRDDFRLYFERPVTRDVFFRSRTRAQYFEEYGSNIFPEQRFTLYQRLGRSHIIAYEVLGETYDADRTAFDEDNIDNPDSKYTNFEARLRYRTNWLHPWLFVEFWPIVAWPEEKDYETTLAARLRLEIHFGYTRPEPMKIDE